MPKENKRPLFFVESIPYGSRPGDYDDGWGSIYGQEDKEDKKLDAELKAKFDKLPLKKK